MLIHFTLVVFQHLVQNSYYQLPLIYIYLICILNLVESPVNQIRRSSLVQPRGLLSPIRSSPYQYNNSPMQAELARIPLPISNLELVYGNNPHYASCVHTSYLGTAKTRVIHYHHPASDLSQSPASAFYKFCLTG